jgi:hypothetical protein
MIVGVFVFSVQLSTVGLGLSVTAELMILENILI